MADHQPEHPTFTIAIPTEKAAAAAKALRAIAIDFDPVRDMTVQGHMDTMNDQAAGKHLDHIRREVNEFLTEEQLSPNLPKGRLSLTQCHELLTLAQADLHWHQFNSVTGFYREDQTWSTIIARYPNLFPEGRATSPPCDECGKEAKVRDTKSNANYCQDCAEAEYPWGTPQDGTLRNIRNCPPHTPPRANGHRSRTQETGQPATQETIAKLKSRSRTPCQRQHEAPN